MIYIYICIYIKSIKLNYFCSFSSSHTNAIKFASHKCSDIAASNIFKSLVKCLVNIFQNNFSKIVLFFENYWNFSKIFFDFRRGVRSGHFHPLSTFLGPLDDFWRPSQISRKFVPPHPAPLPGWYIYFFFGGGKHSNENFY